MLMSTSFIFVVAEMMTLPKMSIMYEFLSARFVSDVYEGNPFYTRRIFKSFFLSTALYGMLMNTHPFSVVAEAMTLPKKSICMKSSQQDLVSCI